MDEPSRIERTLDTGPTARLELSNLSGSITVRPWERHEVRVTATIDADGSRDLIDVSIEGSGNVVTAKARPARIDGNWVRRLVASNNIPSVHFEISCPGASDVIAKSAAGDIDIANLEGGVDIDQAAGRTRIADHVGNVDIKGVSGEFSGTKLDGSVRYKSVTGNLEVLDSRVTGLSIQTVTGKIVVDPLPVADEPISIHTVSDQTKLTLDPASHCRVTLRTVTGTINTDLPFEVLENSRTKWEAQLNGGGREIGLKSVSGNFDLVSAVPVDETSGASAPRPRQGSPANVLKSLEGGDIDVDEALKLLESGSHPSNPNPK
ncbi:MAG: DUF4097 family beta strand repeat-containing protein [Chloroflexi bacterium]|nr:DUF4097 family beta strand repeat-containing protein [Chloroflexota bacterium]MCY3936775.1 DUF4097 family beta strand repeat-containing protein [Chloroflexota bacterium]